ncbi:MAG TPA: SDR family oxidoreductase [Planctomicrobium sp.]|nr:SDR family oxidoreductase [Planctomicrobium sp.]
MSSQTVWDQFSLRGKTALITGATGHLGSAMAQGLAEAGARVIATSREQHRAEEVASSLPAVETGAHVGVSLDHMDEEALTQGFQNAIQQAGQIDILVNNGHEPTGQDWTNVSAAQFTRQLENLTGYFLLSRLFRDHVVEQHRQGSLIFLGSMYGQVASYPDAYDGIGPASPVAYHALKGGVIHMTRHLAVYWATDGVRVNCLSPGPFPSEKAPPGLAERLNHKVPMGRIGRADELKGAIVFLASDASSYMTGQNLTIDGGWTAW